MMPKHEGFVQSPLAKQDTCFDNRASDLHSIRFYTSRRELMVVELYCCSTVGTNETIVRDL